MKVILNKTYGKDLEEVTSELSNDLAFDILSILNNNDSSNKLYISNAVYDKLLDELYVIVENDKKYLDLLSCLINNTKKTKK